MAGVKDFDAEIKETQVYKPQTTTADQNSASVNMTGYNSVAFYALLGATGDTLSGSIKWEFELEESVDDSAWTDVPNAKMLDTVTGTNVGTFAVVDANTEDETVYVGQYIGSAKFVRCVINATGTHTNGTPIAILAMQSKADVYPVA